MITSKLILKRFKALLSDCRYKLSTYTNNEKLSLFLNYSVVLLILLLMLLSSCNNIKYIPLENETKVLVRDSIVFVNDTIEVEVPKEIVKEIVPQDTISILNTSVSISEARIDNGMLYHSLEQKGTITAIIDTCYVTRVEEKITYKYIPKEVLKEVKYIPNWVSYSLMLNIALILVIFLRLYHKLKNM